MTVSSTFLLFVIFIIAFLTVWLITGFFYKIINKSESSERDEPSEVLPPKPLKFSPKKKES